LLHSGDTAQRVSIRPDAAEFSRSREISRTHRRALPAILQPRPVTMICSAPAVCAIARPHSQQRGGAQGDVAAGFRMALPLVRRMVNDKAGLPKSRRQLPSR
jgi:hypothetical protein